EATVLAAGGGLAMGAWELPSDMLAQLHQGEMVVPAGVTPWAQGVISGAANTPGVNTVHVNHATNFNVNTMDARSFNSYAMGNRKALVRAINEVHPHRRPPRAVQGRQGNVDLDRGAANGRFVCDHRHD
ncbi:MAG: hypothetical protein WAM10_16185, partial [Methylocella sp.]